MKYKDGKKYRRKIGQSKKDVSIYSNLGHPHDVLKQEAIFIGKEEKAYSLTKEKPYKILDANSGEFWWDKELAEKCKNKKDRRYNASQTEDYFITIINDKGNKRKYSHLMFKIKEETPTPKTTKGTKKQQL